MYSAQISATESRITFALFQIKCLVDLLRCFLEPVRDSWCGYSRCSGGLFVRLLRMALLWVSGKHQMVKLACPSAHKMVSMRRTLSYEDLRLFRLCFGS